MAEKGWFQRGLDDLKASFDHGRTEAANALFNGQAFVLCQRNGAQPDVDPAKQPDVQPEAAKQQERDQGMSM